MVIKRNFLVKPDIATSQFNGFAYELSNCKNFTSDLPSVKTLQN